MLATEAPKPISLTDRVFAGLRSYASLRLLTQVASWAGTVYVVRHLTSHAMGQYSVAFVTFSYLAVVYDGTLLEALIQRPPLTAQERRAAFTLVAGMGLILALAAVAAAIPIARLVGDSAVAPLVLGVSIVLVFTSFSVLPHAMLARAMAFPRLASIGAIQSVSVLITTVWLATRGAGAWALLAGLIAGAGVRMVLMNAACWTIARPTLRLSTALGYLRFGGVLFIDNVLWRWYTSLDTFLLGRWAGTAALGYYSLAQQTAELPLERVSRIVNDISLPAYAELSTERSAAAGLLLETIRTHAVLGFPVFWGIAAVASLLVPAVFGSAWGSAVLPLAALAAVAPLRLIGSVETPAMTGLGCPQILVRTKSVIVPCMTAAMLVGCWFGGIDGAALAWASVFPLCYGYAFKWVLQAAAVSYRQMLSVIRGPAAGAAVMAAFVLSWEHLASSWTLNRGMALGIAIGVGAVTYAAGLRLIDPTGFRLALSRAARIMGLRTAV